LVLLRPAEGYRALALKAIDGAEPGVKTGVNEKGLVIVSATANQVPSAERKKIQQQKHLLSFLLASCAGIDDVLKNIERMRRPAFYLVGDRKGLALIEVAPNGSRSVVRRDSGALYHTNHYCDIATPASGRKSSASSLQRYARIAELLNAQEKPFTVEDFIHFSEDQTAGPDNGIWRTGGKPTAKRTLATWLVSIPISGSPRLYLKLADPGEPEQDCSLSLEAALRLRGGDRIPLNAGICRDAR
jgi:hypothetical protein